MSLTFDFSQFDQGMHRLLARVDAETKAATGGLLHLVQTRAVMPAPGHEHPVRRSGDLEGSIVAEPVAAKPHRFGV